jgi:hypothetical protein
LPDRIEYLAAFGEVIARDSEFDLVLLLFEVDHDARGLFGPERFVHRVERVGQPSRRIAFQHFALHDQLALAAEFERRADLPVRDDSITEPFAVTSVLVSA